jgi:hypothetical protein
MPAARGHLGLGGRRVGLQLRSLSLSMASSASCTACCPRPILISRNWLWKPFQSRTQSWRSMSTTATVSTAPPSVNQRASAPGA